MDEYTAKQIALINKLYSLTLEKKLDWIIDDFSDELCAKVGSNTIELDAITHDSTPFEIVRIKDRGGNTIQSFTDGNLPSDADYGNFDSPYGLMISLHEIASRQASKVEETLDDVLLALDRIENPPKNPFDTDLDEDVPF